jgi:DNA-binding transcriptional LysR family regulator
VRFHRTYPDVRVELTTGTTGALVARVLAHEVEAAFVAEPFTHDGLDGRSVFTERLVLIAPSSRPRIRGPREVGHTTLIAFPSGCSYRRRLEAWLDGAEVVPERVMEFGSYHAIVACVAAGTGIAIVPRSVLRVTRADVTVSALPDPVGTACTWLVWRRGHRSIVLDALRGLLPRGPRPETAAILRGGDR